MSTALFQTGEVIEGCAVFLGQHLDLRRFQEVKPLATSPLTIRAGTKGIAVLFRYGAVVLFGMQQTEISEFIAGLQGLLREPFAQPEKESFEIIVAPDGSEGIEQGRICLRASTLQALQTVADVCAKSAVLSYYEASLSKHFDRIEPLAEGLTRGRLGGLRGRDLLTHIGNTLLVEARMIGRIEVSEKPELTWDYPEYERLYLRLEDEYDLAERHAAIEQKLELISKTAQTLVDLTHAQRTLRVEWYIVILIVAEIAISLVEKLL